MRRVNPYTQFVQAQMDERGWNQADLERQSGVHRAVLSRLLGDKRTRITRPPERPTIEGLAKAFGGGELIERRLWAAVARAMGLPVGSEIPVPDLRGATNGELLREVSRRLAILDEVVGRAAYGPDYPKGDDQA